VEELIKRKVADPDWRRQLGDNPGQAIADALTEMAALVLTLVKQARGPETNSDPPSCGDVWRM